MKVQISFPQGEDRGIVHYNPNKKEFRIEHTNPAVVAKIKQYLSTKREYRIPESSEIDDFRVDRAYPKDNITYFNLAMCELFTKTGVWVHWETEKN